MPTPVNGNKYLLRSTGQLPNDVNADADAINAENDIHVDVNADAHIGIPDAINPELENEGMAASLGVHMPPFHGNPGERGDDWLNWYINYAEAMGFNENKRRLLLPFQFRDHAMVWYESLPQDVKSDWETLTTQFKDRFNGSDGTNNDISLLSIKQNVDEPCASYFTRFSRAAAHKNIPEAILVGVVIKGLLPSLKKIVMPRDPQTIEDVRKLACLGERTLLETVAAPVAAADTADTVAFLTGKLEEVMAVNAELRHELKTRHSENSWRSAPPQQHGQHYQQRHQQKQGQYGHRQQMPSQREQGRCGRCGGKFHPQLNCPAYNETCSYCKKPHHYRSECYKMKRDKANQQ